MVKKPAVLEASHVFIVDVKRRGVRTALEEMVDVSNKKVKKSKKQKIWTFHE